MRIISGIAGGIRLASPKNDAIRPTSDRVKESIFAVLGDLRDRRVLDLFAGSGALGLEALSRGAAAVTLVEKERRHAQLIDHNLATVRQAMAEACPAAVKIVCGDVANLAALLADEATTYDIILADPPYQAAYGPVQLLADPTFVDFAGQAIVVVEHDHRIRLATPAATVWRRLKESTFGDTAVTYLRRQ